MTVVFDQEYTTEDKSTWGDGPWQDEPDKAQWVDRETDLDCLIVRSPMGCLCGYVGIPETHPLFGSGYDSELTDNIDVHGGLTFAGSCDDSKGEAHSICHVPLPGRSDKIWWLGFDCGHAGDVLPKLTSTTGMPIWEGDTYRGVAYVIAECEQLAKQLA